VKTTRNLLKTLILGTEKNFATIYTGFPTIPRVEDICNDGNKKGGLGIFCKDEDYNWKSSGFEEAILIFEIFIYVDATQEIYTEDRGVANEEWLIEKAESVRDILFTTNNEKLDSNTKLEAPIHIKFRMMEGPVRAAMITVKYKKRYVR